MYRTRKISVSALAALCLVATGCATNAATGNNNQDAPTSGGVLAFAINTEPNCLDPHVSMADATALINRGVVDSLVSQESAGGFKPWLAKSWKIAPDLKTYTFELRTDVRFHDGTPFNAVAVKTNFDRIAAPATKSQYAKTLLGPYKATNVVGEHTVEVKFNQAFAPFLQAASSAYLGMQSPKGLVDHASESCRHIVGSGPFVWDKYVAKQQVNMRRNTDHNWAPANATHNGATYVDGLSIRFMPENSTRLGALNSKQIDAIGAVLTATVGGVKSNANLQYIRTESQGAVHSLFLNTVKGPFADVRVRQAFQRSLNLDPLVKSVHFGEYSRAWSLISSNTAYYDKSLEGSWPYDADKANRLLDEAGWKERDSAGFRTKDGNRLTVRWPTTPQQDGAEQRKTFAQGLQSDAKKIGIEVALDSVQVAQLFDKAKTGDYDITDTAWTRADADILRGFLHSKNLPLIGQNYSRVNDQNVDNWVTGASQTIDDNARRDLYAKAQKWAIEQAVVVPLYTPAYLVAASNKVRGLTADPAGFPLFRDAWLAK